MNRIIYAAILVFCLTSCKKNEADDRTKFVQVVIQDKSNTGGMAIKYDGKVYYTGLTIAVALGDKKFEVFNRATGKTLLDTTLNIPASDVFYLYQADTLKRPFLVRSPLSGEADAPLGYMKLKIANKAMTILPFEKMDLVVTSFYQSNGAYIALDTLHNVTADFNTELFVVKRQVIGDVLQQLYRFNFVNSVTGETVKNNQGAVYSGSFSASFNKANLYMIELTPLVTPVKTTTIPYNGKFYNVSAKITWER